MALDACVYCDCFERGLLSKLPDPRWKVVVAPDGSLDCDEVNEEERLAFYYWLEFDACEHEGGFLAREHLGNIALISLLRQELNRFADRFPVLLARVLYNGTHCGDLVSVEDTRIIKSELFAFLLMRVGVRKTESHIRYFGVQMKRLVEASLKVAKPLCF